MLLPRKKQHALAEMEKVLLKYLERAKKMGDAERRAVLTRVLALLYGQETALTVDLDALAEWWLDLIRPVWYERLKGRRGLRPLLLKDIRKDVLLTEISTDKLRGVLERDLFVRPLHLRAASAIVGVSV